MSKRLYSNVYLSYEKIDNVYKKTLMAQKYISKFKVGDIICAKFVIITSKRHIKNIVGRIIFVDKKLIVIKNLLKKFSIFDTDLIDGTVKIKKIN
jgi:hypothetical protein